MPAITMSSYFRPENLALADSIRALDSTIFGLTIIDRMGKLLAYSPKDNFLDKNPEEKEAWGITAQRMALLFSMAVEHNKTLSPLQSIVLIREKVKEIAVQIPHMNLIIIALVPESVNGAMLSSRICKFVSDS